MSATRRPASAGDNILARLERSGGGAARRQWSRAARTGAVLGALLTAALAWVMVGLTQDKLQEQREAQVVILATPEPPAAPSETQVASQIEPRVELRPQATADGESEPGIDARIDAVIHPALDPNSLEPIPVLPVLADVVEKAPAAPAPPAKPPRPRPASHAPHAPAVHARAATEVAAAKAKATAKANAGKAADSAVETDVALLSAILLHAPRHSAERARAEAKCKADKNCTLTGPLPALLKATE